MKDLPPEDYTLIDVKSINHQCTECNSHQASLLTFTKNSDSVEHPIMYIVRCSNCNHGSSHYYNPHP